MSTKDGGPAFPRPLSTDDHSQPYSVACDYVGMSLRDWFAGMALQGILSSPRYDAISVKGKTEAAYVHADSMLSAREGST